MCTNLLPDLYGKNVHQLERLGCERLRPIEEAISTLPDIRDARRVDARFLEALADELQTYFLDGLTETQQREAIARSLELHRIKGTIGAVEKALDVMGLGARVNEWFDTGKDPYTFDVEIGIRDDRVITQQIVETLRQYVEEFKNLRSHLDEVIMAYETRVLDRQKFGGVFEVTLTAPTVDLYEATVATYTHTRIGGIYEIDIVSRSAA